MLSDFNIKRFALLFRLQFFVYILHFSFLQPFLVGLFKLIQLISIPIVVSGFILGEIGYFKTCSGFQKQLQENHPSQTPLSS